MYNIQLLGFVIDKSKYVVHYNHKIYKVLGYCLYDISTKATKYVTTKGFKNYVRELEKYIKNDCNVLAHNVYLEGYYTKNTVIIGSDGSVTGYDRSIEDICKMTENKFERSKLFNYNILQNSAIFDINTGLFKYDHLKGGFVGMLRITQDVFGKTTRFLVKHDFSNCEDSVVFFTFENLYYTFTLHFSEMRFEHPFVRLRESLMENVVNIQVEGKNYLFLKSDRYIIDFDIKKAFIVFTNGCELTLYLHTDLESLELEYLMKSTYLKLNIVTSSNIKDSILANIFYELCLKRLFELIDSGNTSKLVFVDDLKYLRNKYLEKDYKSVMEYDIMCGICDLHSKNRLFAERGLRDLHVNIQYLD